MKEREQTLDERYAGLFQPDTLLPSQFFDRVRRRTEHEGERRLMIAVLEDAVDVYRKQAAARDARGEQLFREAEEWIEDRDRSWLFSFENICDVLDIDGDYLRRGLHEWKARARGVLQRQAQWLQRYPNVQVLIAGNADERGTREYNLALGARRANATRDFLSSLGVSGARMQTISYGKERPIDPRSSEEGWAINRNAHTQIVSGAVS